MIMVDFKGWITNFPRQYRTHKNADLSLDEYWKKYHKKFHNVKIGCSFDPDLVKSLYSSQVSQAHILSVLRVLIHDFGMKDIRLGVKWSKAVDEKGNFDFSYYKSYLDYCLSNNVNVCLNVGPIKTFGWPEEYIPQKLADLVMPNDYIELDSKITANALEYLQDLLAYIKKSYSKRQLQNLIIIQPENESFNEFGKLRLQLSEEYVTETIKMIHNVFPDKKILLSSSETKNVAKIVSIIERVADKNLSPSQFICGINYYYNLPSFLNVPLIGPIDNITVSNILQRQTAGANIKSSRRLGYTIEVTEAQFEQWGRAYLSPGNSFHEAKYLFARIVENILDPKEGGLIRLWGFERYAKKMLDGTMTHEHEQNLLLIQKINGRIM